MTSKIAGIQIPGRLARLDEDKDFAYLVDIDDTFCAWASRRASSREKLYEEQAWKRISREEMLNDIGRQSDKGGASDPGAAAPENNQSDEGGGDVEPSQ